MHNTTRILLCIIFASALTLLPGCNSTQKSVQPQAKPQATFAPDNGAASGRWRMELKVSPNHPRITKPITFVLHIADDQGRPVNDATVNGSVTMKLMDMGVTKLKFAAKGDGAYESSTTSLDMSGAWSVAVEATQGSTHVSQSFDVVVYD